MGELKCLIELNKNDGILIKLKNPDDSINQTIILDGQTITATCEGLQDSTIIEMSCDKVLTTCKGSSDSSTIEQLCDTITVTSKNFIVKSDTTLMESMMDTTINAMNLETNATDTKVNSTTLAMNAMDTKINSTSLATNATTTKVTSADLTTNSPNTTMNGANITIGGTAMVTVTGGIIKLN